MQYQNVNKKCEKSNKNKHKNNVVLKENDKKKTLKLT